MAQHSRMDQHGRRDQRGSSLFEALGIGAAAEAVYETLLDRPATTTELASGTGIAGGRVEDALAELETGGLISRQPGSPARYVAVDPEIALDVLLLEREQQIKQARARAQELGGRFRRAEARTDPAELVEIITGRAAILRRVDQVLRGARDRMRILEKPPYHGDPMEPDPAEIDLLRRGGSVRVVYDQEGLAMPGRLGHLERACAAGEEARTLACLPTKLAIVDDKHAIVPLRGTAASPSPSFVVVHRSALLNALAGLFETLWRLALPLELGAPGPPGPGGAPGDDPSADERRILALLTSGLPDESVARQLGMSARTYQRRVHDLMDRLRVQSRFQLARQATRRGWLA